MRVTPYDLVKTCQQIEEQFETLMSAGCKVLAMGGDHTITYPILKAVKVSCSVGEGVGR